MLMLHVTHTVASMLWLKFEMDDFNIIHCIIRHVRRVCVSAMWHKTIVHRWLSAFYRWKVNIHVHKFAHSMITYGGRCTLLYLYGHLPLGNNTHLDLITNWKRTLTYRVFAPRVFDCRPHFLLNYTLLHIFKSGMLPHLLFKRKHVLWDWTLIDKHNYKFLQTTEYNGTLWYIFLHKVMPLQSTEDQRRLQAH